MRTLTHIWPQELRSASLPHSVSRVYRHSFLLILQKILQPFHHVLLFEHDNLSPDDFTLPKWSDIFLFRVNTMPFICPPSLRQRDMDHRVYHRSNLQHLFEYYPIFDQGVWRTCSSRLHLWIRNRHNILHFNHVWSYPALWSKLSKSSTDSSGCQESWICI